MKKINTIITFVTILAIAVSLCACTNNTVSSNEIYFLNFKPEISSVYEDISKAYKDETGVSVKIVTAASGTYEQTLKSEIAKTNAPTIFQINGPVGFESWKNYCADITDTNLYRNLTNKSLAITDDGNVYAVPYAIEGYGIIYNREIMDKYFALPNKKSSVNSTEDIDSFAKLKEIAEDMQANKEALGISGVFASTSLASGDQWRWQTHLANVPFYYEFKEKSGYENTISAIFQAKNVDFKYNQNFKNVFDLYTNNSTIDKKRLGSKTTSDSMAEFALGQCAMVQNGDWAWSQINEVPGNTVKENNIGFLPIYIGVDGEQSQGICIGTENYFAINNKVSKEKQDASIAFLEWLFSSETGKSYVVDRLGFNAPFNTFSEDEKPTSPLSKEVLRYLETEKEPIEWTFLGFASDEFKNQFGSALLEYVQGNIQWSDVVKRVQDSWKTERAK